MAAKNDRKMEGEQGVSSRDRETALIVAPKVSNSIDEFRQVR
jgi:hypothetical protein